MEARWSIKNLINCHFLLFCYTKLPIFPFKEVLYFVPHKIYGPIENSCEHSELMLIAIINMHIEHTFVRWKLLEQLFRLRVLGGYVLGA